eukprot:2543521-Pleurochrysis_carterae.AAC.2
MQRLDKRCKHQHGTTVTATLAPRSDLASPIELSWWTSRHGRLSLLAGGAPSSKREAVRLRSGRRSVVEAGGA